MTSEFNRTLGAHYEPIRASVVLSLSGQTVYGLPEHPSKRSIQHQFEAKKAMENISRADQASAPPSGLRYAACKDLHTRINEQRENDDGWKRPNKPAPPGTLTSLENPLYTAANDPAALPYYQALGQAAVQAPQAQVPSGKRCYIRNERYGMMEQLEQGSLIPLSGEAMYQARSEALGVAGGLGGSRQRSAGSRASGDDAETAKGTNRGDAWVQVSATGSSGFPTRDKSASEEARRQELIETAEAVVTAKELEARLLRDYPHGVPKHVLLKAQRDAEIAGMGVRVPTIGYGDASSISSKLAAASLRP